MIKGLDHVLIVGGGIGGMAAAIALRSQGVPVDLIDSDPEWRVYGAGITITGPTLRAYRDLGLLDDLAREGFFCRGQKVFLYDGTPVSEASPPPAAPGLPSAGGIMRPQLHRIMSSRVRKLGADVRLGITAEDYAERGDDILVTFSDGTKRAYSLVVAADGIYSQTRAKLFPDAVKPQYVGQMSWRVTAPRPPEMDSSQFYFGHRNLGGINPCSQDEVYAFVLHPEPEINRIEPADQPAVLRSLMAHFGGHMAVIREGIGPDSSIMRRPFEYALQPRPWHVGRVVLLGDAAHATTPHLASGAGIAVEDALVLAEELARHAPDVPSALSAYADRRFDRCRHVIESSVAIAHHQLAMGSVEELGAMMAGAMRVLAGPI